MRSLKQARLLIPLAIYLFSQILFLITIQFPVGLDFDEFHYIPSAKQYLEWRPNQNWEHPPLGKLIMAVGIAVGGDRPFGWRLMSTVFGAATLVGMYFWGLALFKDRRMALWVAAITLVNQLLYVQARIGMLDTFMTAFIVWGLALFSMAWDPSKPRRELRPLLLAAGVMFGLGVACKWFTVMPWFTCVALVMLVRLLQSWKTTFGESRETDWFTPSLWKDIRWRDWILWLGVVPVLVYAVTFIPLFAIQHPGNWLTEIFAVQKRMYEGQLRVTTPHPYMSSWTTWALMTRPIWYAFDKEGVAGQWVRGVVLIGNPIIMWGGLVAMAACAWGWLARRDRAAFLILAAYAALYLSWALVPRKVAFYYYYFPAGMVLSLSLAWVFDRVIRPEVARWVFFVACLGMFIWFFPLLAARQIPADSFRKWMWLSTWI